MEKKVEIKKNENVGINRNLRSMKGFISLNLFPHLCSCFVLLLILYYYSKIMFEKYFVNTKTPLEYLLTFSKTMGNPALILINIYYVFFIQDEISVHREI